MSTIDDRALALAYRRSADQDRDANDGPARHPVVVVGAGPVGLTLALDLGRRGVPVVLLDDDDTLSTGSRAICFAKRTLEIWDRLGCGDAIADAGVSWNVGKVFFRDALVWRFDLQQESGHRRPAFVNLPQWRVEAALVDAIAACPAVALRTRNRVVAMTHDETGAMLSIETPDGPYAIRADRVVACDGGRSPLRAMLGLASAGHSFRDRFLIVDVRMSPRVSARFAAERWFWFDPPFHRGQSVLLHRQPDDVWRIDFQLGWDADPVAEREPARIASRVRALLAASGVDDVADDDFTFEWMSVYTFACLRMERFRHGRVLFAGDAAHGVSPFGARGANSGVQDADNLGWKLAFVAAGRAPDALLDTYDDERVAAADENIRASTRSTDFITPKSGPSRTFRDAVLALAADHPFARKLVDSGRLSVPAVLAASPLNTPDVDAFEGAMVPGAACADAPVMIDGRSGWLLDALGDAFALLVFAADAKPDANVARLASPELRIVVVSEPVSSPPKDPDVVVDIAGLAAKRYDARPGSAYLIRPDRHVCARWRRFDERAVAAALVRASGVAEVGDAR